MNTLHLFHVVVSPLLAHKWNLRSPFSEILVRRSLILEDALPFSSHSDTGMTVLLQGAELGIFV